MSRRAVVRVGIAGLGRIAPHHIAAIGEFSEAFQLVGGADVSSQARAHYAWLPTYAGLRDLVLAERPDIVVVATPPDSHFEIAAEAIRHGCSVLIEKPAVVDMADWHALCRLADEAGVGLHSALHFFHAREVAFFRKWATGQGEALGELAAFHSVWRDPYVEAGRVNAAGSSLGGAWTDSCVNALSAVGWAMDMIRLEGLDRTVIRGVGSEDVVAVGRIGFEHSARRGQGVVEVNWCLNSRSKNTYLLFAESGRRFRLNHSAETVVEMVGEEEVPMFQAAQRRKALTEHYVGVYGELLESLGAATDNRALSSLLHAVLWSAGPDGHARR
jgi:D-galactose 1-dehydrogenase